MKILIVDDDPVSRRVLKQILSADPGSELVEASTGAEAWTLLTTATPRFDATFLDLSMPEMDGLEVLRRIRADPALSDLPVILCTSSHDRPTVLKAAVAGARHYIVKPASAPLVFVKLQQAMAGAQNRTPAGSA